MIFVHFVKDRYLLIFEDSFLINLARVYEIKRMEFELEISLLIFIIFKTQINYKKSFLTVMFILFNVKLI